MKPGQNTPRPAGKEPEPRADVEVGDHLFVDHQGKHCVGEVHAHGRHGVTVSIGGGRHPVRWDKVLGHKKRVPLRYSIIEQGEDGMLVEDERGRRRFVGVPNDAKEDPMLVKAFGDRPVLLFMKADAPKGPPRAGLTRKQLTDKNGVQTTRMVRTGKDQPAGRRPAADHNGEDTIVGAESGYGTHNLQGGDTVNFAAGDFIGAGTIVGAPGSDGAHVKDASGRVHQVRWSEIRGHDDKGGAEKPKVSNEVRGEQKPIPPDQFQAADYAKSHDDAEVTPEAILAHFPPDTAEKIAKVQERLGSIEQTIDTHMQDGEYAAERAALHDRILDELLSDEKIAAATPPEGQAPTFIILGGRGGSGKSWFEGNVYDPEKSVVLDADHIKGMLPEYEGWNAAQVHEESGQIFDRLVETARTLGLNVVLDKTMKTAKSAIADVQAFKDAGYRTEAHYMHLPRQEAAKRAVQRFLGKTNRYVPVEVVLSNTSNEQAFDQVRGMVDGWSFRDNNVAQGQQPILISQSGGDAQGGGNVKGEPLTKSDQTPTILLWKIR